jgi:hypothetical protein
MRKGGKSNIFDRHINIHDNYKDLLVDRILDKGASKLCVVGTGNSSYI